MEKLNNLVCFSSKLTSSVLFIFLVHLLYFFFFMNELHFLLIQK